MVWTSPSHGEGRGFDPHREYFDFQFSCVHSPYFYYLYRHDFLTWEKSLIFMLVRKFVGQRLAEYYSQPAHLVVGSAPAPIPFQRLWGSWHWKRIYGRLYRDNLGQWLTPVELFQPYFSNTIANFVSRVVQRENAQSAAVSTEEIDIVELGGGRGTNARLVLDHLEKAYPDIYNQVQYTIIDSSPTLIELQKKNLSASNHMKKIHFEEKDLANVAEGNVSLLPKASDRLTIVLALELFDNLPHDKIQKTLGSKIEQAEIIFPLSDPVVEGTRDPHVVDLPQEIFVPLSDPLLEHILEMAPTTATRGPSWLPTIACGLLEKLAQERCQSHLLVADFDWLPPPDNLKPNSRHRLSTWAQGEPLVTSMDDFDHSCYLSAPPYCDILFPTNFKFIASFAKQIWRSTASKSSRREVRVEKQADFLQRFGPEQVNATKSWLTGYTPLVDDFVNCSVLTVTSDDAQVASDKVSNGSR